MDQIQQLCKRLGGGAFDGALSALYGQAAVADQRARYQRAAEAFGELFGAERAVRLFSAPGRTEVGGNHTDHQHGRVLAAGVNLDAVAVAAPNGEGVMRIQSAGYPQDVVDLSDLAPREEERNRACSLIRGVAARLREKGYAVAGFDAYTTSDVLSGSGLSSSAAFEVLVGAVIGGLWNGGNIPPVELAKAGQYAENVHFGKPSGLMDQTASAVGGFVEIDFADPERPAVEKVGFDLHRSGYHLCIVDTKGDHSDLTADYAAIPSEMRQMAACFGREVLREVPEEEFFSRLGEIYGKVPDRAVARAIHFYGDNGRVPLQAAALRAGDLSRFLALVVESGRSSSAYLQNLFAPHAPEQQGLTVALALSERLLAGRGAWRVHGGGFAGTIQAFVPDDLLEAYRAALEGVYGAGSCRVLSIRPVGACEVTEDGIR